LDTFIAWTSRSGAPEVVRGEDAALREAEKSARGALFVISHQGSPDLARAVLDEATRRRLTILVHTRHARNYSRLLKRFRPEAVMDMLEVSELGPEAAIALQQKVEAGRWIVIAGDRVPITGNQHVLAVPFLGRPAAFPVGPYLIASFLDCPVYSLFCLRDGDHYRLDAHKLADRIVLPRQGRTEALKSHVLEFAALVEGYALKEPFQWYNFFEFWQPDTEARR
jgi:predicted LPLAT superfamily acyltransferase